MAKFLQQCIDTYKGMTTFPEAPQAVSTAAEPLPEPIGDTHIRDIDHRETMPVFYKRAAHDRNPPVPGNEPARQLIALRAQRYQAQLNSSQRTHGDYLEHLRQSAFRSPRATTEQLLLDRFNYSLIE